jgi:PAS domain S-box-containing protein
MNKSAQLAAAILDNVSEAIIAVDIAGNILHLNGAAETILGCRRNQVAGKNLKELVDDEGFLNEAFSILAGAVSNPHPSPGLALKFTKPGGQRVGFSACIKPLPNGSEKIGYTIALQETADFPRQAPPPSRDFISAPPGIKMPVEEYWQATISQIIINMEMTGAPGVFEDANRCLLHVNQAFYTTFGIDPLSYTVPGGDSRELMEELSRRYCEPAAFLEKQEDILTKGQLYGEEGLKLLDKRAFEHLYFPFFVGEKVLGHLWIYRNVTVRSQAEESIMASEELLRTIFEGAAFGISLTDLKGRWITCNHALQEMFGYSEEELRGRVFTELTHPEDIEPNLKLHLQLVKGELQSYQMEKRYIHKDGRILWGFLKTSLIRDDTGKPRYYIAMVEDITERKRSEMLQASLFKISEAVHYASNLDELFVSIHDVVASLMPASNFYIALYDHETDTIDFPYWVDEYDPKPAKAKPVKGLTEYVLQTGRPLLASPEAFWELERQGLVETIGAPSIDWLGVPLKNQERTIGVLVVQTYTEGVRFGEDHKQILTFVSDQVAMAIGRKQAQEQVDKSLSLLRATLDSTADGILVIDNDGRYANYNNRFLELWGLTGSIMQGQTFVLKKILDQVMDPDFIEQEVEAARADPLKEFSGIVELKDGRVFELYSIPQHIAGAGLGRVWSIHDITQLKRAEEALRKSERERALILDSISEQVVYHSLDMKAVWANRAAMQAVAPRGGQLLGRFCYEHRHQRQEPCPECPVVETLVTKLPQQRELAFSDQGKVWFVRGYPVFDSNNELTGAVEVSLDITERKKAEEAFHTSESKYRQLVEYSPNAILAHQDGYVLLANPAAALLLGANDPQELIGKYIPDMVPPKAREELLERIKREMNEGMTIPSIEQELIRFDGKVVNVDASVIPFSAADMTVVQVIYRDITEQKKMEEEILKARKLDSLGILAGGIAHDFNNMLTAIFGNISLSRMLAGENTDLGDRLFDAEKACLRAKELTQQLLTFSKGGAPIKERASISDIVKESADFALRGSNVRCEFNFSADLLAVEVDSGQISQVIHNLVINADQAMASGGIIRVSAENVVLKPDNALSLKPGKYCLISVADQGLGIPAEHLPKIFDPYFTTKQKGSGLGLATTYSVIKRHDGAITVESELGIGTTFRIFLPALDAPPPQAQAAEAFLLGGHGKILIVDDEEAIRELISRALAAFGYEVDSARDGASGVEKYRQALQEKRPFHIVILDLTIPGGMGGKETLARLQEIDPQVVAIASSGYSNDPILASFREHGFKGILAKPYDIRELQKTLQDLLHGE